MSVGKHEYRIFLKQWLCIALLLDMFDC